MKIRMIFFVITFVLLGCSTTHYGRDSPQRSVEKLPPGLRKGQTRTEVFGVWGPPDTSCTSDTREHWTYRVMEGSHFLLLGYAKYDELVITFENQKVIDLYYLNRGKSYGLLAPPGYSK